MKLFIKQKPAYRFLKLTYDYQMGIVGGWDK